MVVVNPTLLDNHQLDIANALMEMSCLISCPKPEKSLFFDVINKTLPHFEFKQLAPPNTKDISQLIFSEAGII